MDWKELDDLKPGASSFRLVIKSPNAGPRQDVDKRLWDFIELTSLDLSGIGLTRLENEEEDPVDVTSARGQCAGLRRLTRLRDLTLSNNSLGPSLQPDGVLYGLAALRSLDLQGNALEALPPAIVSLESLTNLNVGHNNIQELQWANLSLLSELRSLSAPHNQLPSLEASVTLPPRLVEVTLRGNKLTEDGGLAVFAQLSTLVSLDVAENSLTSLPEELALTCGKLSRLVISNNPFADKKLANLAERQAEQAPAKAILELLRKGQSKRNLKAQLSKQAEKARPPPPRLYRTAGCLSSAARYVTVSREVLGVRPHILMAVLHVVAEQETGAEPLFFYAEGGRQLSPRSFQNAFESNVGLLERDLDIQTPDADEAASAVLAASARLQSFVAAQTRIHADPELGDKRRRGSLGSHNAAAVTWPLRFHAAPHGEVRFSPLAIGWMESKGVVSAATYAEEAARGHITGAAKDVAVALQRPASALLKLPLCPYVTDETGVVLSVHPLSNGWETRTTVEAQGAVLLECSSGQSEACCRAMLLALIREAIELIEGREWEICGDRDLLRRRRVKVLVEPVDVVFEWDHKKQRAQFPSYEELQSLPPLPAYCGVEGNASNSSESSGSSSSSDSGDSSSSNSDDGGGGGYPQAAQAKERAKGRGRGGRKQKGRAK